jgi:hypothetical protein
MALFSTVFSFAQYTSGNLSNLNYGQSGYSQNNYNNQGQQGRGTKKDSLQHRDALADSITIFFKYFDSTRLRTFDSSLNDFSKKLRQPYWFNYMGNFGTAATSLLFNPVLKPGWDAGFHEYDSYNFKIEDTRFFQTTRPYTELGYMLGTKSEQLVDVIHTQNKKENFNFSFEYRFSNAPGVYRILNASINNLRFTTHYQSRNKRYESFLIYMWNKNAASTNGGLISTAQIDDLASSSGALNEPYQLQTRLGEATSISRSPFNTQVNTGDIYSERTFFYRHQYDFGQKDSLIINDTTKIRLFYARFRLQHTLSVKSNSYQFMDVNADSAKYLKYFLYQLPKASDTIQFKDNWANVSNELSVISFPDKKNQSQFLKLGAVLQNLQGVFADTSKNNFYNVYGLVEYRNRTRNQKWDVELNGQLYLSGLNAGDYGAWASLKRELSKKIGYLQLGFQNINRTPSFIFNPLTSFKIDNKQSFNKENYTRLFAQYENPKQHLTLNGEYYLVNNYTYFDSFFIARQEASLFNLLHVSLEKRFKLSKYFNWYTEVHLQQTTGGPVHVPFILTRNRLAFEGNFYRNLFLSTGVEVRYYSNYKADDYSPFNGQFVSQNTYTTSNLPDINLFFDFRIKSFKGFVRLENLNTANISQGFIFNKYNFVAPLYPYQPLWVRVGIWWSFVN